MKLLRSYIFWTYERGSFHYDVMVTLILLFLFVSPHMMDFKDRPVKDAPLQHSEVLVRSQGRSNGESRFTYDIRVDDLHGAKSDEEIRAAISNIVEPISGNVTIEKYAPVVDTKGHIVAYEATILR